MGKGVTFCRDCRRHFDAERVVCPVDGAALVPPSAHMPAYGEVVDQRYVVMERIGSGGMGSVFRAFDTAARMDVALKVVSPAMAHREDGVERFFREVRAVSRLQHPNVVSVHGFGRTADGLLYLVMELLSGECLSHVLRRDGWLPVRRVLGLGEQVAAALDAAHRHGVVHRDLKPENFRLLSGNLLKILDFGIASLLDAGAQQTDGGSTVCGTPAYMSPEHALGLPCEPRSDLYGLGVLLFELLTGHPPFTGSDAMEVIRAHLVDAAPTLSETAPELAIPEPVSALVQRLLSKSLTDRPRSAIEVRAELRRLREGMRGELDGPAVTRVPAAAWATLSRPEDCVPFHDRPTLLLDGAAPSLRATLPDVSSATEAPTAVMGVPSLRLCPSCGCLNTDEVLCTHCETPITSPKAAPTAGRPSASDILRATVGADPRFAPRSTSASAAPAEGRPASFARRLSLLHVKLRANDCADDVHRGALEAALDDWRDEIEASGGLLCHDSGAVIRVVFGMTATEGTSPPASAVKAACALRALVRRARRQEDVPVTVRAGIATATVHLDTMALASPEWGVRGSAVDLAARLARIASDGTILLDAETATSLSAEARSRRVGQISVRGSGVPHPVFAALSGVASQHPTPPPARPEKDPASRHATPPPVPAVSLG